MEGPSLWLVNEGSKEARFDYALQISKLCISFQNNKKPLININKTPPLTSTSFPKHFNYLSMSSLPKSLEDGLKSFIKFVIPTIIHLKYIYIYQGPSDKVEQWKRFVEEAKLHKSVQILTMKIKQEQG
jgi:hypothetical protein